ncbi:hypothetical protein IMCC3317_25560 [Kordia antarctica]|uniref:N-acetyltransferase domain-containing protein n=1 Tax=Kordia antarctica TaxID=1218801 RepID=A0A7L4ZKE9_9FLAO|nr:hypothetical protein [Kordia antarctica]QHI37178.1 hypothetical protein IMCC3317_25560 [Kordia antarctica]
MKSSYQLKRIKKSSDDSIIESLIIYSDNIEPQLRTDSNQILYWLDNYSKNFDDSFYVLNFYLNNKIIGYSQLTHFVDEKIIFVDYIVLDPLYRRNNTFYEFLEQIRYFLSRYVITYDYIFAEVGSFFNETQLSNKSRNIVRLLKLSGFKVIKAKYYHPSLASKISNQSFKSVLMVHTGSSMKSISKEAYLKIIEVIYFKHYLRWYSRFLIDKDLSDYTLGINDIFEKTKLDLKSKKQVDINGYSEVLNFKPNINRNHNIKSILQWLAMIIIFIILVLFFAVLHIIAKDKFKIETDAQYYIILFPLILIVTIVAIFSENKNNKIAKLLSKLFNID